jgi:L-iditol 2-dehydrogenase
MHSDTSLPIPETMSAVVVHAPHEYGIEQKPVPELPTAGLLLKVDACGLCGSDLRTLRSGHRKVTFPWTIGHEISGTLIGAGPRYDGPLCPGDRLAVGPLAYCGECDFCLDGQLELCENYREIGQAWPGGLAEYVAIPAECVRLGNVRQIPMDIDPAYAAIAEPVSSCIHAQEKGAVGLGDTVVILGTGAIGCIHTSLAHARGADRVILVDVVPERLRMAQAFEPDHTINAAETDLVAEVRRLTGGKGPDVVITANPAPISQIQAVEMAKKGGRILLFGGLPKDQAKPQVDMNLVHYNALHLIGTTIFAPRHNRLALHFLQSGRLNVEKLISRFPLQDFNQGAALALAGKVLKAVFLP